MGALEYAPATAGFETSSSVQIDSLYQLLFQEREKAIVLSGEALNLQSLYEVGTSAGGQHPKAIATTCRQPFPRIRFKTPCAPPYWAERIDHYLRCQLPFFRTVFNCKPPVKYIKK